MYSYNISNHSDAVREIKKYLYLISRNLYPTVPKTTIDGFYDEETKAAVREFQKIKGIEESGDVDYLTFSLLFQDYSDLIFELEAADYILEDTDFPLQLGNYSEDVRIIHLLINELRKTYTDIPLVGTGKLYTKESEKAVLFLRDLFLMEKNDKIDKKLYYRIKKEINAIRNS